jgi:NTE family protein
MNGYAEAEMTHMAIVGTAAQRVVLVFQGGGALGAYQAGVYHALHEAGIEPDWIIGTSIGAINASLIAGNEPERRLPALKDFWARVVQKATWYGAVALPQLAQTMCTWSTLYHGIPGFFEPNALAFFGAHVVLGADRAGYYLTTPLERTLVELVDFSRIERCSPRLTVGAAHVRSGRMRYFDSREMPIGVRHVMASGALPPAFPPVRVDGELYWDGGILSNTPTEVIFDECPRRSSLIFAVHIWNPDGAEPETMREVMHRHSDIQYSSRVASHVVRQKQTHQLRHVINELLEHIPEAERNSAAVRELAAYGCLTRMHIVRLLAPRLDHEDHTKALDFSPSGIRRRWEAGYASARRVIDEAPWLGEFDPLEGVIVHEPRNGVGTEEVGRPLVAAGTGGKEEEPRAGRRRKPDTVRAR